MDQKEDITESWPPGNDFFRVRIINRNSHPAYIRLFDPEWEKSNVTIDIPIYKDPTNGRLEDYHDLLKQLQQEIIIEAVYIWCPSLARNLDLFTLHIYERSEDPYVDAVFSNLRIRTSTLGLYQFRDDCCVIKEGFPLNKLSCLSFHMPAMETALLDLFKVSLAMPI